MKFITAYDKELRKQSQTFEQAEARAKELNEKVYLCIYSFHNIFGEVYDKEIVDENSNIEEIKEELIKSFNKLTKN